MQYMWSQIKPVSFAGKVPEPELPTQLTAQQDRASARSIARVIFFIKVLEPKKVLLSGENDWMVTSPVDSIKIKQEKSLKF